MDFPHTVVGVSKRQAHWFTDKKEPYQPYLVALPPTGQIQDMIKSYFPSFPGSPLAAFSAALGLNHPSLLLAVIISFVFFFWVIVCSKGTKTRHLRLPPGPKPLPLIGNLHQMNTAEPWLTYTAWKKQYGDLLHVRLLGQSLLVLNSEKMARILLDQRSALYSDRPAMMVFGVGFSTAMLPYGDEWRLHRKLFHYAFRAGSEARYREVYLRRARELLENLLDTPAEFEQHIKGFVAASVMALAYGYETAPRDDPMVTMVMSLVDLLAKGLSPERSVILYAFSFLEKLPGWVPGTGLWRDAALARKLAKRVLDAPFYWVKEKLKTGSAPPSMVADCLTQLGHKDGDLERENAIKGTAATIFVAGFETSSSTLHSFVLAMVLYPEVQAKAQAEIDAVIGSARLPHFDDRASLPYVDAILRELVRWSPVIPLGIPHATSEDDVVHGYHIPKGTPVLINVWAIGRDDAAFSDVDAFQPERFLDATTGALKDGPTMAANPIFGLGRRICPGRFASEAFVWTAVASILATFRIAKAKDARGVEVDVEKRFTTGLAIRPVQFPCAFVRRSDARVRTIREGA